MKDKIFGELTYYYGWNGMTKIVWEQKKFEVFIKLQTGENKSIDEFQYNSFQSYLKHEQYIWNKVIEKIYFYYLEEQDEYRKMYEEEADVFAPYVNSISDIVSLITPIGLVFPQKNNSMNFGILLECIWDSEAGIGVRIKDNEVIGIGTQDIIL